MGKREKKSSNMDKGKMIISNGIFMPNFNAKKAGRRCWASNKDGDWQVFVDTKIYKNYTTYQSFLWNKLLQIKVELPSHQISLEIFGKCIYSAWGYGPNYDSVVDAALFESSCEDDIHNSLCFITRDGMFYGQNLRMRSPNRSLLYWRRLVVIYGEERNRLLLVERLVPYAFEVWEVDFSQGRFVSVNDLDGIVIIVSGNNSASYRSHMLKPKLNGNCICFTESGHDQNFYMFSFADQSMSVIRNRPCSSFPAWFPSLSNPNRPWLSFIDDGVKIITNHMETNTDSENAETKEIVCLHSEKSNDLVQFFCNLPQHLQMHVAESLSSATDYANFRLVCRQWRESAPPIRYFPNKSSSIKYPWLMLFQGNDEHCSMIDPTCDMRYYLTRSHELSASCKIRYSKDGWLLITQDTKVFFFEPFSQTRINLPDLPNYYHIDCISFSSAPTCSDWTVVSIRCGGSRLRVMYLRSDDEEWNDVECGGGILSNACGPVFHDQKFYLLHYDGSLSFFWWEGNTFQFSSLNTEMAALLNTTCFGYLVSCADDLLLVVAGLLGKLINVYKLDMLSSKWIGANITGEYSIFISGTSSFAVPVSDDEMRQRTINFPLFVEDHHLSCNVDASGVRYSNIYERKGFLCITWIQPKVIRG